MKIKNLFFVLLTVVLVFSLCACGGSNSAAPESSTEAEDSESESESEVELDIVDGELVTFKASQTDISATIVVPEGWSFEILAKENGVKLRNDDGQFVIQFSEANVTGLLDATEIEGKTIGGYECRGQTKDGYVEYIGEDIAEKCRLYIYTSTFDEDYMKSPEVCDILDTVVVTVN